MTFPADSHLVSRVVPGLGYTAGALRTRTTPVLAGVVHTTGSGPVARFEDPAQRKRHHWDSPLDAAAWVYSTLMEYSGHYVVDGETGAIVQCVPENMVAEHVGRAHFGAYAAGHWLTHDTQWWQERWPNHKSPLDLAGGKLWAKGTCNGNTIGVEVVPRVGHVRGAWTPAAWTALTALLRDIGTRHGVPLDREHIVTHSDASPLSRSVHDAPWDPTPTTWQPEWLELHLAQPQQS